MKQTSIIEINTKTNHENQIFWLPCLFNKYSLIWEDLMMCCTGGNWSEMKMLKAEISSVVLPRLDLFFSSHFSHCFRNSCISVAFCFHYIISPPCCAVNFKMLTFKAIGCTNSYLCTHELQAWIRSAGNVVFNCDTLCAFFGLLVPNPHFPKTKEWGTGGEVGQ